MVVNGRDFYATLDQLRHDGIYLGLQQDEIAHRHDFALHGFERDPAAEGQCRFDDDAIERHGEVGARETVAVDVARYRRLSTERRVDLLPVDVLGAGSGYRRHDGAAE